jgi:hypothetical protein
MRVAEGRLALARGEHDSEHLAGIGTHDGGAQFVFTGVSTAEE